MLGFAVRGDATEQLEDVRFSTVAHRPAFGLYVWPTAWSVGWRSPRGPAELRLRTVARRTVFNFRVAGFAMAVVAGIWTDAGVVVPVYGLAELLVVPRYLRRLAR